MTTLVLDLGNSRLKWGIWQYPDWLATGVFTHQTIPLSLPAAWRSLPRPIRVIGGSVAPIAVTQTLDVILRSWQLEPVWLKSNQVAEIIQNKNRYQNPGQLGIDRLAAAMAAWEQHHQACLIANFGTATTLDSVSFDGTFLGGAILPGLELMRASLTAKNQALASEAGAYTFFPTNTKDAVVTGCFAAQLGALDHEWSNFERQLRQPPLLILTGGAACTIGEYLSKPYVLQEHLVLDGLVLLDQHTQ